MDILLSIIMPSGLFADGRTMAKFFLSNDAVVLVYLTLLCIIEFVRRRRKSAVLLQRECAAWCEAHVLHGMIPGSGVRGRKHIGEIPPGVPVTERARTHLRRSKVVPRSNASPLQKGRSVFI